MFHEALCVFYKVDKYRRSFSKHISFQRLLFPHFTCLIIRVSHEEKKVSLTDIDYYTRYYFLPLISSLPLPLPCGGAQGVYDACTPTALAGASRKQYSTPFLYMSGSSSKRWRVRMQFRCWSARWTDTASWRGLSVRIAAAASASAFQVPGVLPPRGVRTEGCPPQQAWCETQPQPGPEPDPSRTGCFRGLAASSYPRRLVPPRFAGPPPPRLHGVRFAGIRLPWPGPTRRL